jgi:hypothetical protein
MAPLTEKYARIPLLALAAALLVAALAALWSIGPHGGMYRDLEKRRVAAAMRTDLFAASEAEKSAVLADTDEASLRFAESARAAVSRLTSALDRLKAGSGGGRETELLRDLATALDEYRTADAEVLDLAVQNSNLKALALSHGPAEAQLDALAAALAPLGDNPAALRLQLAVLRIQALHAPHVMEKTEDGMTRLEARMAKADAAARAALDGLPHGRERAAAQRGYAAYWKLTGEIVALSRRNTNMRSLELSLTRTTRLAAGCAERLDRLEALYQNRLGNKATR